MHLSNLMTAAKPCRPLLLMGPTSSPPVEVQQAASCSLAAAQLHVLAAAAALPAAGLLHGTASHTGPAQQAYHPGVQAALQEQ